MRFDVFTNEDRMAEARAAYADMQWATYAAWAWGGMYVATGLIYFVYRQYFDLYDPGNYWIENELWDNVFMAAAWPFGILNVFSDSIVHSRGAILLIVSAVILFLLSFIKTMIGIYQGVLFGIVGSLISYFSLPVLVGAAGFSAGLWVSVVSVLVGILIFVLGVIGFFAPDV